MKYVNALQDQLESIATSFITSLPSMVVAILVLLVTWILARSAARITARITSNATFREDLKQLLETMVRLTIWLVGILVSAAIVFPDLTPASLIGGLGIGALAIGFAFQDIFENFLAGVLIMLRDKMQIGDIVEAEGILGKVEKITLRETHIRQFSNELTILPNSMIFKNPVQILTDAKIRRNEVVIGVSYDTDLPHAERIIRQSVEAVTSLESSKSVDVLAVEFNSSSVDFLVRFWTNIRDNDYLAVKSEVIFAIKRGLDDAGIEIPFPYVTHTFKEPVPIKEPGLAAA